MFLLIGGAEALVMRIQLMWPGARVVSPDLFNQMMTMHGTTMIFFVAMPILAGVANYIVPLQIGARDMAFPRLNAFGLWVTLFGGVLAYFSFATGGAPTIGWFAYAPLTERAFARGQATDFWILGLLVSGIGSVSGAINLVDHGALAPLPRDEPCGRFRFTPGWRSGPTSRFSSRCRP